MSKASRLGYDGEHAVELYLNNKGFPCYRPRAGAARDRGDLAGLAMVVSVKNHATLRLAEWLGALPGMCEAAGLPLGVVWHKRRNRASPGAWYVTMTGETFLSLLDAYSSSTPSASGQNPATRVPVSKDGHASLNLPGSPNPRVAAGAVDDS